MIFYHLVVHYFLGHPVEPHVNELDCSGAVRHRQLPAFNLGREMTLELTEHLQQQLTGRFLATFVQEVKIVLGSKTKGKSDDTFLMWPSEVPRKATT